MKPCLYRPHRQLLDEAMAEVKELKSWDHLIKILKEQVTYWKWTPKDVYLKDSIYDQRIGWATRHVCIKIPEYESPQCVGMTNCSKERLLRLQRKVK